MPAGMLLLSYDAQWTWGNYAGWRKDKGVWCDCDVSAWSFTSA